MKIDISQYRRTNKRNVKWWFKGGKGPAQWRDELPKIATASQCPIIVICHLFGECYGFTPELRNTIQMLVDFYGYTDILGKKDYCGDCNANSDVCDGCLDD